MKAKKRVEEFRSLEQVKATLFPRMTDEKRRKSSDWSPAQDGECSANAAINKLLNGSQTRA